MTHSATTIDAAAASAPEAYRQLIALVKKRSLLGSTASVLAWDQETMMPPRGVELRSRQLAQLAGLTHEMATSPQVGELLQACEADAAVQADSDGPMAVNVREIRREYDRETRLPGDLVEAIAETAALAKAKWVQARKANDYSVFAPWLGKNVELALRAAECYGWDQDGEPWDALAEGYEPGMTARDVAAVFAPLRRRLVDLVADLTNNGKPPSDAFHQLKLPIAEQERFVRDVAACIGFDFQGGRLDQSTHPFCSGQHPGDVRMTTRFHEDNVADALGSTMHESGHGIYEQGLPEAHWGTPRGSAVGLSIHESQSRTWENQVGRSRAFWTWCYSKLREYFGLAVTEFSEDEVYASVNLVQPSLIRVEADEATYNLHIMVRFELERALMRQDLSVADLPAAWNEKYKDYLGLDVPDDARGCMQDIHWSMGAIGYFPTYTLGNLYAAQFFEAARQALPDLDDQFARGEFAPLKAWLRENIHQHGMTYRSADLCERVTGQPLSADPLLRHLEGKLRPVYGL